MRELKTKSNQVPEPVPTAPTANQEDQGVTGIKLLDLVAALSLVLTLVLLDTSIVATVQLVLEAKSLQAIPRITSDLHCLADIGWYGGAYQLDGAAVATCCAD